MLPQAHSHVAHFEFPSLPSPNAPPSVLRPTAHRGARIAGAQGGRDAARRRREREGRRERDVVSRSHGPQDTLPSARSHWAGTLAPGESRAEAHAGAARNQQRDTATAISRTYVVEACRIRPLKVRRDRGVRKLRRRDGGCVERRVSVVQLERLRV